MSPQVREDVLSSRTWRAVVDVCRKWLTAAADGGGSANQDSETEEPGIYCKYVYVAHRKL